MMYRAFGLFGDHIRSFEIITANSEKVVVTQDSNPELFFAVLGGCPGNFGVLTHVTIEPHRDSDHPHSLVFTYTTKIHLPDYFNTRWSCRTMLRWQRISTTQLASLVGAKILYNMDSHAIRSCLPLSEVRRW